MINRNKKIRIFIFAGLFSLVLLPFLITSWLFFLKDPLIWPDEALFFDMAKHLLSFGTLKASLYSGTNPIAVNTGYGYPPLYFALLGVWTIVFGSTIESVRALSLVLGILSLCVFFLILKQLFKNPLVWYLGAAILSFDITFSRASRVGRMEILVLLFFLLSIYFFLLWQKQRKPFQLYLISILSGLTMLTHPVGVIVPAILVSYIFFDKSDAKIKNIFTVVALAGVVLSLWLIPLKGDLLSLLATFNLHWQNKSAGPPQYFLLYSDYSAWFFLLNLTLIIVAAFIFTIFRNKGLNQAQWTILLGLIISSFVALMGREGAYMVMISPFIVLCLAALLQAAILARSKAFRLIVCGLIALFVLANINIQFFNNDNLMLNNPETKSLFDVRSSSYHALSKLTSAALLSQKASYNKSKTIKVYLAATPDPYFDLKEFPQFVFFEAIAPLFPITPVEYKALLDNCDYIVYNWIPNQFFYDYIKNNTLESRIVSQSPGYSFFINRLVSRKNRK